MQDDDSLGLTLVTLLVSALILFCVGASLALGISSVQHGRASAVDVPNQGQPRGEPLARIYFESGSAILPDEAGGALQTVKELALAGPAAHILISGFHDPSGDPEQNAQLAKQRAETTRDALIEEGIASERIILRKPQVIPGTQDMQEARRVDIHVQ
jgi:outer membrane protein OmpA-like peptidoglycan-associated protein